LKKKRYLSSILIITVSFFILGTTSFVLLPPSSVAVVAQNEPTAITSIEQKMLPQDNGGKKWRVGYCESESFVNYAGTLYGILKGLEEEGWITGLEGLPYQEGQEDTLQMWKWLGQNDIGPYLEFVQDQYYCLSAVEAEKIEKLQNTLQKKDDVDVLLVMGTYAGTIVAAREPKVPVLVFSTSNAVNAGTVKSEEYSGRSNIWAHMDTRRFQRQVTVSYDIFKFKKLGIVYEDSAAGRSFSALTDVEKVAAEKGFSIVERHVDEPVGVEDIDRYYRDVQQAYQELAETVDGMYVTVASLQPGWLEDLFTPFYEKNIPIFTQLGENEVKYGALMSVTMQDFIDIGRFGTSTMIRALKGEDLGSLPQVFESTPRLSINLEVAEKIGYKVPFELLLVADKVYTTIGDQEDGNQEGK